MACGGCGQARSQLYNSARRLDVHGAANAIRQGAAIISAKARGTYDDSKYVNPQTGQVVAKATPYQPPYKRDEPQRTG